MFFEPNRSPYDLNFRLFGIDVRVHPMFWLVSVLMGWSAVDLGFEYLLVWVACVFVSILVHELGHVFAGKLFGSQGHIVLYSFGGLAIGSSALRSRWQRIFVYFAGPAAGFLLAAIVALASRPLDPEEMSPLLEIALLDLYFINVFWGLVNLLPIWPLDGGQISRDLLGWLQPVNGTRTSLGISVTVAGLLAFLALVNTYRPLGIVNAVPYLRSLRGWYMVLLFACLAFNSYQLLQIEDRRRPWDKDWDYWER